MLCECGCGMKAPIAKQTNSKLGYKKGQPLRFIRGHSARINQPFRGKKRPGISGKNHPLYGKHHSPEARAKMSAAHKGKKLTEEHKLNIGKVQKGKIVSAETRQKISIAKTGIARSPETITKISKNHADFSGVNHPRWKGGISCEPYCPVFKDNEWR